MQVELASAEGMALTLQSQFGGQQAGVRLKMKCLPVTKEIRGTMWHSWSWLQDRGLPRNMEVAWYMFFTFYWFIELVFITVHQKTNTSLMIFFSKGLCSIQGAFAQLQSRAQLIVDGHKLLASGLNVSVADGRLALLLSFSPPASNQTRPSLDATLAAQFKGQIITNIMDAIFVCCSPLF